MKTENRKSIIEKISGSVVGIGFILIGLSLLGLPFSYLLYGLLLSFLGFILWIVVRFERRFN